MKTGIHPKYFQTVVTCACGNTFTVGSTKDHLEVEICAKCHPFFTGEMKFVDTLGRVEKFQAKKAASAASGFVSKKAKVALKKQEEQALEAARPKSLKEMLDKVRATA